MDILWGCYFPQRCELSEFSCLFLPLVGMHGEQTGLILGNLCYAMSYQPAGLPRDVGSKRNSVSQLLLRQTGADFHAALFLGDLLQELNIAAFFHQIFVSTAGQPQEPPWSPPGVGVSSTCFLHSSSELTQQDTPG